MSKFLLRNLKNERRRIEKELKRIDKKIDRIENTEVIMEGSLELKSLINIDKTTLVLLYHLVCLQKEGCLLVISFQVRLTGPNILNTTAPDKASDFLIGIAVPLASKFIV